MTPKPNLCFVPSGIHFWMSLCSTPPKKWEVLSWKLLADFKNLSQMLRFYLWQLSALCFSFSFLNCSLKLLTGLTALSSPVFGLIDHICWLPSSPSIYKSSYKFRGNAILKILSKKETALSPLSLSFFSLCVYVCVCLVCVSTHMRHVCWSACMSIHPFIQPICASCLTYSLSYGLCLE